MKILIVQDFEGWAIGQLSRVIKEENPHHKIEILSIHPRDLRNDPEPHEDDFQSKVNEFQPDLIHFQYWDLANRLQHLVSESTPMILTHHNQKNLLSGDWKRMKRIIVHTKKAKMILMGKGYENVDIIQHGIDLEKFRFNDEYDSENKKIGYVGRIVPWKGLYEILKCAKELNTKVIMMGRIDKGDYWKKCLEFEGQMDVRFGTPDDKQVSVYHEMGVYVGNSCDNIEEGTLGLLEAMSCGIPVVTTLSGEAEDIIKDGENGIAVDFEHYESLSWGIKRFFELSKEEKNKMREKAWNTVRNLNCDRMGWNYEKCYRRAVGEKDLVSVIIPTCNREGTITKILDAYSEQSYKPIELIVVNDNSEDRTAFEIAGWSEKNPQVVLKYIDTHREGYNLAMARNMGALLAQGNYLLFSDDRMLPRNDAVDWFVRAISGVKDRVAIFGEKGGNKKTFVENFFIIRKRHFVDSGMFLERITEYGGMSQEYRERLMHQGFNLIYESKAVATPLFGTHNRSSKRYELLRMKNLLWKLQN